MTNEILGLMGKEIKEIFAPSYIFYEGKLVDFPITPANILSKLHPITLLRAVYHLFLDKYKIPKGDNFRDFAYRKYGMVIADLFLTNYSEKLWGLPTEHLSTNIAGSRLKDLNLKTVITEFLYPNHKAKHLEGAFYYPEKGFGRIADRVGSYCSFENISLNSRITKIFHEGNRITGFEVNGSEKIEADEVVSSLPLSVFLNSMHPSPPEHLLSLAKSIKFRHLKLIGIFLDKPSVNNAATIYFPDKKYLYTRVYEPRNRSPFMSPKGKTSLVIEIPYSFGDPVEAMPEEALLATVKAQLLETKLFREDQILDMTLKTLPFAYPILEKHFEEKIAEINNYFGRFENLYHTGRNGKFVYSWTHNMMQYGQEIVKEVKP